MTRFTHLKCPDSYMSPECSLVMFAGWLQGAMDYLHEQNQGNKAFQPVLSYTLNPKCVSMGELFGEYDPLASEWKDGLASTLIRSAVTDATPVRKWVVFDGPVDALWIENMNTVCHPPWHHDGC